MEQPLYHPATLPCDAAICSAAAKGARCRSCGAAGLAISDCVPQVSGVVSEPNVHFTCIQAARTVSKMEQTVDAGVLTCTAPALSPSAAMARGPELRCQQEQHVYMSSDVEQAGESVCKQENATADPFNT
ncbi:hypothetical protein MBLNU230_g7713t1 [Neophaeotheca triangularis]